MGDGAVSLLYHPVLLLSSRPPFPPLSMTTYSTSSLHAWKRGGFGLAAPRGTCPMSMGGGGAGGVVRIDSRKNERGSEKGEMRQRLTHVMEDIMLFPPEFAPVKSLFVLCLYRQC